MKEELQSKLVEILGSIQTAAGKAGDFAMTQLPDIAQQYVIYGRVVSVAGSVTLLVFAAALAYLSRFAYKNPWNTSIWSFEKDAKRSDSNKLLIVMPAIFSGLLSLVAILNFNWLVWFAPKVWLLKEIAGLIK